MIWLMGGESGRDTAEKLKFSIKYFISTCEQIPSFPRKEEILNGKLHELLNKI